MCTKEKKKILLLTTLGILCCVCIIFCLFWFKPVNRVNYFLKQEKYKKIVSILNREKLKENDYVEIRLSIENYMDLMMKDWNEESISYEKASNVFAIFTDVKGYGYL